MVQIPDVILRMYDFWKKRKNIVAHSQNISGQCRINIIKCRVNSEDLPRGGKLNKRYIPHKKKYITSVLAIPIGRKSVGTMKKSIRQTFRGREAISKFDRFVEEGFIIDKE